MHTKHTLAIATSAEPVRKSLTHVCTMLGIAVTDDAETLLIDGHHTPSTLAKHTYSIVLGVIPKSLTPTMNIPTPCSLTRLKEMLTQHFAPSTAALRNGWLFDAQQRTLIHLQKPPISLTEKEASLLQYLLQHVSQEIGRETLLKSIWAYDKEVDTHTVETHIYRLRQKVGEVPFDIVTTEQGYKVVL